MIRVEVICNSSVEENILDAFKEEGVAKFYTQYPGVFGVGNSGPRMGSTVWPEENTVFVIWCEEEEARGIQRAVLRVKEDFPTEGIKIFAMLQTLNEKALPPSSPEAIAAAVKAELEAQEAQKAQEAQAQPNNQAGQTKAGPEAGPELSPVEAGRLEQAKQKPQVGFVKIE
jgi:hypothetical protein